MSVRNRYSVDPEFKRIIGDTAKNTGKSEEEVLEFVSDMERGLKRLMSSGDNRIIFLKYIGQFRVSYKNLRRKLLYFIRLYRKGFLKDKGLIRDTYLDLKEKNIERLDAKRKRAERISKLNKDD